MRLNSWPQAAGPAPRFCPLPVTLRSAAISGSSRVIAARSSWTLPRRTKIRDHLSPLPNGLLHVGLSAPQILARDLDKGLLLLGDFG